jgi:hypothetical protein
MKAMLEDLSMTDNIIAVSTCDASLWPAFIYGVLLGVIATSVAGAIISILPTAKIERTELSEIAKKQQPK